MLPNKELLPSLPVWLRPHMQAIEASLRVGFQFRHLPTLDNLLAVQGIRVASGAMDIFMASSATDALAARFRVEDLERGTPPALWHRHGSVAEVVFKLLELPPHGTAGAPVLAAAPISDLWVPPSATA